VSLTIEMQQTIEQISSARDRREEITTAITRIERQLQEATMTLHGE